MNNTIMLFGLMSGMLFAAGLAPDAFGAGKAGMVNPASVYCAESGYKTDIRTSPDGSQYRVCIFPDGKECEEWTFFRTECGTEYRKLPEARKDTSCKTDSDCACGTHVKTGACFYGSKIYVNTEKQCPNFCGGIAENLTIRCLNNECKQVPAKE